MNVVHAGTVLLLALCAFTACAACAAERDLYTIVDRDARVLRKTTWYQLEPGARAEEGDVIDVAEHQQVQLELARGTLFTIIGPALVHLAALPSGDAKPGAACELTLLRGWYKAANTPKAPPLRLELQGAALALAVGIIVVHPDPAHTDFFVESGRVTVVTPAARGKELSREAAEGEFWHRIGDRVFETADRPSSAFITEMPRELRDALPRLAEHFDTAPTLPAGREITFAEAEPWLSGESRRAFARRFAPRLADHAFRADAAAATHRIPEWDRTLHPERYRRRDAADAPAPRAVPTPATIR
jgi:hypothetical protein